MAPIQGRLGQPCRLEDDPCGVRRRVARAPWHRMGLAGEAIDVHLRPVEARRRRTRRGLMRPLARGALPGTCINGPIYSRLLAGRDTGSLGQASDRIMLSASLWRKNPLGSFDRGVMVV